MKSGGTYLKMANRIYDENMGRILAKNGQPKPKSKLIRYYQYWSYMSAFNEIW